jgi:hypothetical protein
MTKVTIDDKEYEFEKLSENAKGQLVSLQYCDGEIQRLSANLAAIQTARLAYAKALHDDLNGETITDVNTGAVKYN